MAHIRRHKFAAITSMFTLWDNGIWAFKHLPCLARLSHCGEDILNPHFYLFWNLQYNISSPSHTTIYALYVIQAQQGCFLLKREHAWRTHTSLPVHGWANHRSKVRWLQKHSCWFCIMLFWPLLTSNNHNAFADSLCCLRHSNGSHW